MIAAPPRRAIARSCSSTSRSSSERVGQPHLWWHEAPSVYFMHGPWSMVDGALTGTAYFKFYTLSRGARAERGNRKAILLSCYHSKYNALVHVYAVTHTQGHARALMSATLGARRSRLAVELAHERAGHAAPAAWSAPRARCTSSRWLGCTRRL